MNTFVNPMTDDWTLTDGDTVKVEKEIYAIWPHIYQIKKLMYHLNSEAVTQQKIEICAKQLNIK